MLLLKALGHRAPEFAHLPLITGPGGKKLSKRDSMTGLGEIRRWLPAALINHLALLGWTHPAGTEILAIDQLVESFDLIRVSTSPAAHDPSRLSYLERAHLVKMQPEEILAAWEKSSHGIRLDDDIAKKSRKILSVVGDEMTSLGMVAENVIRLAEGPSDDDITEGFRALDREDVADTLRAMRGTCAGSRMDVLEAIAESRGKAKVYLPIRIALTGKTRGFEMSRIFGALTTAEIDKRLLRASELLEKLQ
jgi:nondiscriminating glutamyl-tRNA synthetase